MSDFWWGVFALPLVLLAVAVAVYAVLGSWLVLEKWAEHRTAEHNHEPDDNLYDKVVRRRLFADWVLAAPKMRRFKLGFGCCLLYVRGLNRIADEDWNAVRDAVYKATTELYRADSQ